MINRFIPTKIKNFNKLKSMLKIILSENKNIDKMEFFGGKDGKGMLGIYVRGMDSKSVRQINVFFPISDINEKFRRWNEKTNISDCRG